MLYTTEDTTKYILRYVLNDQNIKASKLSPKRGEGFFWLMGIGRENK